tara:strand:+ start:611 stop:1426 length:816 start_codon:yes stop_codon:yes gene_type:complete
VSFHLAVTAALFLSRIPSNINYLDFYSLIKFLCTKNGYANHTHEIIGLAAHEVINRDPLTKIPREDLYKNAKIYFSNETAKNRFLEIFGNLLIIITRQGILIIKKEDANPSAINNPPFFPIIIAKLNADSSLIPLSISMLKIKPIMADRALKIKSLMEDTSILGSTTTTPEGKSNRAITLLYDNEYNTSSKRYIIDRRGKIFFTPDHYKNVYDLNEFDSFKLSHPTLHTSLSETRKQFLECEQHKIEEIYSKRYRIITHNTDFPALLSRRG